MRNYDDSADQELPGPWPEPAVPPPAEPSPAAATAAVGDGLYGLPEPGPAIELAAPTNPMAVGRALVRNARIAGSLPYRFWRGEFYQHTGTHYEVVDKTIINKWLYHATENAWYAKTDAKGVTQGKDWSPDQRKINTLRHALSDGLLTHDGEEDRCIALQNGVYNQKTDKVDPHDERRFNLSALPFAFDKTAECPRWLAFLEEILPGDREAQDFLGEWFGYVISGQTDQQKMLSLTGARRCGKGTIARILHALMGPGATASPTLRQLGSSFGEEGLVGRKLATLSDVRWTAASVADATEVLLAISGNDARDVARKNRTNWHGYLGVRFMLMSNDLPNFRDASGALAGRMMQLHLTQTFYGREDTELTGKLIKELPGIFNWAIAGLRRLDTRGYFRPPASSAAIAAEVRRMASPYQAFLEDACEIDKDARTTTVDLMRAYSEWCRHEGRTQDQQTAASLSRGLRVADERITVDPKRHTMPTGRKTTILVGVKLAAPPQPGWLIADGEADRLRYEQQTLGEPPDDE